MADEKLKVAGIKLKIDGAATFSDNLNKINSRLKTNSSELKKVQAQYKGNEKSIEGLTAKQKALQSSLDAQKKKTGELKDVLAETTEEYGENSKEVERVKSAVAQSEAAEAGLEAQLRETNEQLKEQEKSLNNTGKELQQTGEKIEKFGEKTAKVGSKLTTGLTLPIAALGTAAGKMWLDFDKTAAKVETIMDKNVMSADEMKQGILDAANEIGYAAEEYANAVYEALSAGVKTEDAISFVKDAAKLSEAGYTSLTKAVDIQTTAMNAYNMSADEAAHISDVLILTQNKGKTTVDALADSMGKVIPTAKNANVSIDQLGVAYSVMTAKGIKTENTTTYLNSMLNELSKSSSNASKVLKNETGSSFSELMKKGYSVADALQIISDAASKSGKSLNEIFGSAEASKAALTLVSEEGINFNAVLEEFNQSVGITNTSFETMQTDSVKLEKEVARLKNELMEFGKELTPVVSGATNVLSKLTDWFSKLTDSEKQAVVKTLAFTAAVGPVVSVGGKLIKTGGTVVKTVGNLVTGLGNLQKTTVASFGAVSAVLAGAAVLYANNKKKLEEYAESVSRITTAMSDFQSGVDSATSVLSGFDNTMSSSQISEIDDSIVEAENKILAISETAAAESRKITDAEAEEINRLIGMIDSYCAEKISAYTEQQDVVAAMINNETSMTVTAAQTYIASAADAYNQILSQAQQQRTEMYAEAKGDKTLQQEADQIYNETVNAAMEKYGNSLDAVAQKYYTQNIATDESILKINELAKAAQEAQKAYDDYAASEGMSYDTLTTEYLDAVNETQYALEKALKGLSDDQAAAFGNYIAMAAEAEVYTGKAQTQAASLVDEVATAMEGLPKETKQTFTDAMQGALDGLKSKEPALYKKATSIANGVASRMKKALEVNSPSRVTRRLFRYVDDGAIYGLKDKEQELYSQAEKLGTGTAAAISRGYSSRAVNIGTLTDLYPTVNRASAAYSSNRTYNSTYSNDTYDSGIHIGTLNVNGGSETGTLISELETIEYARREQARSRGER